MNRHTVLSATIGVLVLGSTVLASPAASAYPVRDFDSPCSSEAARASVTLLASHYARYLTRADFDAADANGNGVLCVALLEGRGADAGHLTEQPPKFIDDGAL